MPNTSEQLDNSNL
ncbi:hypothetical protein AB3S75_000458 [Citrus x aurantiifolia]